MHQPYYCLRHLFASLNNGLHLITLNAGPFVHSTNSGKNVLSKFMCILSAYLEVPSSTFSLHLFSAVHKLSSGQFDSVQPALPGR